MSTESVPNERECLRIMREEGCKLSVIQHVCTVKSIAEEMAKRSGADLKLVRAGALLHDVGRSRTQGVMHVAESVRIAEERHLPEELVRIIQRHVAAGLTQKEAKGIGLPEGQYMPETLEEKIVCHADNLVKGQSGMQTLEEALDEIVRRGYPVTAERMRAMHVELSGRCGIDIDEIVRMLRADPPLKGPCAAYTSQKGARP
ncbi:MAG: HDIG domain-containing protein [Methanomassiliicoccales archaeon]|nr:HDIG domain-containing protein [Methanomassiliicoccales archaeon]MDD1755810.1 HDIG domain-containing protein [Methanomassiliicoccales archaeon]